MIHFKRACPICGHNGGVHLLNLDFVLYEDHPLSEGYDLVSCEECGFVFADTSVTQSDYDRYYAKFSRYEDNRTCTGGGESAYDSARLDTAARDIAVQLTDKNSRILDVGCANGGLLKRLMNLGFENVVGIDPSPVCVRNTKRLTGKPAFPCGLFNLSPHLGLFDLVMVSHVLEHVFDVKSAVRNMFGLLHHDGMVYVECPDATRYDHLIHAPYQEFNTEHINHFSRTLLGNLFRSHGFVTIHDGERSFSMPSGTPYLAVYGFYRRGDGTGAVTRTVFDGELSRCARSYIAKSELIMNRMSDMIGDLLASGRPIVVWGTGQLTMKLLSMTGLAKGDLYAFVDSSPINQGKLLMGKPIMGPDDLKGAQQRNWTILIASTIYEKAIRADIKDQFGESVPVVGLSECLQDPPK